MVGMYLETRWDDVVFMGCIDGRADAVSHC